MNGDAAVPALVFVTRRPPLPLDNGSRIRTHRLVTGLAGRFRVTLLTFENDPRSPDGHTDPAELAAALPGVEVVTVPGLGPRKRARQARSLLGRPSWTWGQYARPEMRAALDRVVAGRRPAVVHFDDPGVALCGPLPGVFNAFARHNVEHVLARDVGCRGGALQHVHGLGHPLDGGRAHLPGRPRQGLDRPELAPEHRHEPDGLEERPANRLLPVGEALLRLPKRRQGVAGPQVGEGETGAGRVDGVQPPLEVGAGVQEHDGGRHHPGRQ